MDALLLYLMLFVFAHIFVVIVKHENTVITEFNVGFLILSCVSLPSLALIFPTRPVVSTFFLYPLFFLCPCPWPRRRESRKLADCPQLLDVEDMVRMREPDWKCVYTYLQEFYRGLVQKGLVKTKNSS